MYTSLTRAQIFIVLHCWFNGMMHFFRGNDNIENENISLKETNNIRVTSLPYFGVKLRKNSL